MGTHKKYNGYRSWAAWNVALWLHNDEGLYRTMCDAVKRNKSLESAARELARTFEGEKTPDGARYTFTSIREALKHWN